LLDGAPKTDSLEEIYPSNDIHSAPIFAPFPTIFSWLSEKRF
jgi:hypothetical protein